MVQEPQLGTAHALLTTEPRCAGQTRHAGPAVWRRAAAVAPKRCKALVERHTTDRRRGDRRDRDRRRPARLRPHRPRPASRLHALSRRRTRRRPSGRSARSTPASTRSRSTACSTPCAASPPRTRRASTTCPISSRSTAQRGRRVETVTVAERRRDPRHQQPRRAGGSEPHRETDQKNDELMAAGVTIEDPATTYVDRRRRRSAPDTIIHPGVSLEGHDDDRRRLRDSQRRAHRRLADRRSRDDPQPLRDHGRDRRRRRVDRPVRAPAPRRGRRRRRKVGNFVELKKTVLGAGSKAMHLAYLGDATIGAQRQHRRRHHHLQLRRREEAARRSSRTARSSAATRSSSRRSRSARAPTSAAGIDDHARTCRPARSASAPGKQRNIDGLGRAEEGKTSAKTVTVER